jgi:hypothetical protein
VPRHIDLLGILFLIAKEGGNDGYKPKSVAGLHIALGGLPDNMRVEVGPDIRVSSKTVWQLSEGDCVTRKLGYRNPAGALSVKRSHGDQSERSDSILAKALERIHVKPRM